MKHLKIFCCFLATMICLGLSSCKDDNEMSTPDEPTQPEQPITPYEVLGEWLNKDISHDDDCVIVVFPRVGTGAGTLQYYGYFVKDAVDLCNGQYIRFSDLTDDGVTLETWGDNVNLKDVNKYLPSDVTVPELNPIATGRQSVTKVRLAVSQVSTGLTMTGKYEDDDLSIDVICDMSNNMSSSEYNNYKPYEWNENGKISDVKFRISLSYHYNNKAPFDVYVSEQGWLLEDSKCNFSTKETTSSPFLFLGGNDETKQLLNTLQFALNTPVLKLSEYGFTGPVTKVNNNVMSVGKLCNILWFNPIFDYGEMSPLYPCKGWGYRHEWGYDKTQNFPAGTFLYTASASGPVYFYVNASKLVRIEMLDEYWGDTDFYKISKSKTPQFLAGLADAMGEFAVNGIPVKVDLAEDVKRITIFNSELSLRLTKYFLGIILEPESLKNLNDTWRNNGISESEVQHMNENLYSLMQSDASFQLGFAFRPLENNIFYYDSDIASLIYDLIHGY